eukprot:5701774-Pyramimonas_sp.AAC.1
MGGRRVVLSGGSRSENATRLLQMAEADSLEGTWEALTHARLAATRALEIAADVAESRIEMQAYGVREGVRRGSGRGQEGVRR